MPRAPRLGKGSSTGISARVLAKLGITPAHSGRKIAGRLLSAAAALAAKERRSAAAKARWRALPAAHKARVVARLAEARARRAGIPAYAGARIGNARARARLISEIRQPRNIPRRLAADVALAEAVAAAHPAVHAQSAEARRLRRAQLARREVEMEGMERERHYRRGNEGQTLNDEMFNLHVPVGTLSHHI